jgi:putative SOS response-associated peptidase YedK
MRFWIPKIRISKSEELLQPASEHLLLAHPVSRDVNKVSVNAAFLIEEVKPDNQLEIF